ncbi:hypothetical protein [Stenotrophomonas phage StenM_174]|nr:hypothetical protein [Stenotrophomonas phage StenM_174]
MAKDVSSYIKLTVPAPLMFSCDALRVALRVLTKAAGGGTMHEATGVWYDEHGREYAERIRTYQFNFDDDATLRVDRAARDVMIELHRAGEQAVFKERSYTQRAADMLGSEPGYKARIIYAPKGTPHYQHPLPGVLADDSSLRHLNS